jgi:riboflavin synthase
MFTGIVREVGVVQGVRRSGGLTRLAIHAPGTAERVGRLESVSVNGACLSVVDRTGPVLAFDMIPETARLTALGRLRSGQRVHLEPSLSIVDRLNGHVVFGHVDGTGTVVARKPRGGELQLSVRIAPSLRRFVVPKGPVALDGVSLTVGERIRGSTLTVHLIPETLRQTLLGERRTGDTVNVEVDYFAKLLWQFARGNGRE